jgi:prolyl-tRNA editing enzyme YbaK/EbsC (Cys-tRNA(Pro) deacylase)
VDVHNYLTERDIPHEVFATKGRLRSAEQLAAVLDLPIGEVGKVVIFEGEGDDAPVVAIVPAGGEPDPARVRKAAKRPTLRPSADSSASELTQYLPGSIPPVGLPERFLTVIDRTLARDKVLYFAGGESRAVLKIRGLDLVKATGAKVASLTEPHVDASSPGRPAPRRGTRGGGRARTVS